MTKVVTNVRRIEKYSTTAGVAPTIPISTDHTDGSWLNTDIYEGEFFLNLPDAKVFTRQGSSIVQIFQNLNIVLTGLAVSNGTGSAKNYTIASGTAILNGKTIAYGGGTNQVSVANGHASLARVDAVVLDNTGTPAIIGGTAGAFALPVIPINNLLLGYIYVPANYVAGTNPASKPRQFYEDIRFISKTVQNWISGTLFVQNQVIYDASNKVLYKVLATYLSSNAVATDVTNAKLVLMLGGSLITQKLTYTFTDYITANPAGNPVSLTLQLPGGAVMLSSKVKQSQPFVGGGVLQAELSVLDAASNTFINRFDVFQAAGANVGKVWAGEGYNAATQIAPDAPYNASFKLELNRIMGGVVTMSNLNGGVVDIYIGYVLFV